MPSGCSEKQRFCASLPLPHRAIAGMPFLLVAIDSSPPLPLVSHLEQNAAAMWAAWQCAAPDASRFVDGAKPGAGCAVAQARVASAILVSSAERDAFLGQRVKNFFRIFAHGMPFSRLTIHRRMRCQRSAGVSLVRYLRVSPYRTP